MSERIRSMQLGVDKVLDLEARIAELEAENAKLRACYEELIFAVGHGHPEETRHETALRYITEAEKPDLTAYTDRAARAEVKQ